MDVILDAILAQEYEAGQSAAKVEYKPIRQDNGYYILSDGRLWSSYSRKFMVGKLDSSGYIKYVLSKAYNPNKNKFGIVVSAHRLVAEAFIPNPNDFPYVHHKDENKTNNNVDNLQWVSAQGNYQEYLDNNPVRHRRKRVKYTQDLPNEQWKEVLDFPNYKVSSMGRVINAKTGYFVFPDRNSCMKYERIMLCNNNLRKKFFVHRLVYSTFTGDYNYDGYVIDHIDGNTKNNRLDNLRKVTPTENNRARFDK